MKQALVGLNGGFKDEKDNTKDKIKNKREVINIPDCNLKKALNKKFNSPDHAPVTMGQLESLLALSKNEISELSPLCDLTELVTLNLDENKIKWNSIVARLEYNFYIKKMINSKKSEFSGKVVLPYTYRTTPINSKSTNSKENEFENVKNSSNVLFLIHNILKKLLNLLKR